MRRQRNARVKRSLFAVVIFGAGAVAVGSGEAAAFASTGTAQSVTVLSTSADPPSSGTITATATVYPAIGVTAPSGMVDFGPACGDVTLTSSAGVSTATCQISAAATMGTVVTASYLGDGAFAPSAATLTASADQASVSAESVTELITSGSPAGIGEEVTYTAQVSAPFGTTLPTGSVSFADNGVPVTCMGVPGAVPLTPVSGAPTPTTSASCNVVEGPTPAAAAGTLHTIGATYLPDGASPYAGSSAQVAELVQACVTGPQPNPVLIYGSSCVNGATLVGGVTVEPGASVIVTNSAATQIAARSPQASPPPAPYNADVSGRVPSGTSIEVCGTTVTSALALTSSTGKIVIGGSPTSCQGNTVGGSFDLTGNRGGVIVGNNAVSALTVCMSNTPAPTNAGWRNSFRGLNIGQCSTL